MYTSSLHIASGETNEEKEKFVFSLNILGWSNRVDINNAATYRSGTAI